MSKRDLPIQAEALLSQLRRESALAARCLEEERLCLAVDKSLVPSPVCSSLDE